MESRRHWGRPPALVAAAAAVALVTLASACSQSITSQNQASSWIDAGAAMNTRTGTYRVGDERVELLKVVSLPQDMLGLRFAFDPPQAGCCGLFPRLALPLNDPSDAAWSGDVVVPVSDVAADGTLSMRLYRHGASHTHRFVVDLAALGVTLR